jgi:class 3 adenylate cyclase
VVGPLRRKQAPWSQNGHTDIVESTATASRAGDAARRRQLERHDDAAREEVERFRGRFIKSTGDGVLATFDGPARAVRRARAIEDKIHPYGLRIRPGLHTGEIELRRDDIGRIAVHVAARVQCLADPDEILVTRTLTELVAGSGLEFDERGTHSLKGVPGEWSLFAATNA